MEAQVEPEANTNWLEQLAALSGRSADALTLADTASLTLLDGRRLVRVKAIDPETGEIEGAVFEGDHIVDEAQARAAAGALWRAEHGALTPETVAQLAQLQPEDQVDLVLWLSIQVTELPQPEVTPRHQTGQTAQGGTSSSSTSDAVDDEKIPATPLAPEEIPPDLQTFLRERPSTAETPPSSGSKPEAVVQAAEGALVDVPETGINRAEIGAYRARNAAAVRAQLEPIQADVSARLTGLGLREVRVSDGTPMIYVPGVTRAQAETIARWSEVDAVYVVPDTAGPSLANARPTQNANLLEQVGYDGSGVEVAVVEGERAFFANPYLDLDLTFDGSQPYEDHPTAVAGIIRSTHSTQRGLAPGATVHSANGSYGDWGVMSDAIDWGRDEAEILNNSWYWDASDSAVMWAADRQLDYVVRTYRDFVTVASGNFGNGCGSNFSSYVVSPAKGYNVLSVGNYDDQNTLTWTDDVMNTCSSFGDPGGDTATPTHEKPEIAAVGTAITSTLVSLDPDTAVGPVGSGTSYSSPMVAALGANLIQADSGLASYPEAVKAVIMAAALHNIEGDSRLSDVDGVGGMVASAAMASVERGHWDGVYVSSSSFPIVYSQHAYAGERVRFVITWDSNPTSDYTSDPLPADLDLRAYRSDGTTLVDYSTSSPNNFEIVDFIAPATETYQFKISLFGSWSGGGTYMGVGWWRGTYRISPNTGYTDPAASPLGTHLSIYPADWPHYNYWRAMGIRSTGGSDHDLRLYTASYFDDPSTRTLVLGSYYGSNSVDFVVVDGNHRPSTLPEHYRVNRYSGTTGYDVGWSSPGTILSNPGLYGPYTLSSAQALRIFELPFYSGQGRQFTVIPTDSNDDLAMELFRSSSSQSSTWTQRRGEGVEYANAHGVGAYSEQLSYLHPHVASFDWLGLVVYNNVDSPTGFYVLVEDLAIYLPMVMK